MSDVLTFTAVRRERTGTGGARASRREGRVPAIIYGGAGAPTAISVDDRELRKHLKRPGFLSHVCEIDLDGQRLKVLPRDVQRHPLHGTPIHVDFLRVAAETKLEVDVAVSFVNEGAAPGLKTGGVLNVVTHTLALVCKPDAIPDHLEVDLTGLDIGDVIHAEQVPLPAGVTLAPAAHGATIASIAPPMGGATTPAPEATESAVVSGT